MPNEIEHLPFSQAPDRSARGGRADQGRTRSRLPFVLAFSVAGRAYPGDVGFGSSSELSRESPWGTIDVTVAQIYRWGVPIL